MSEQLQFSITNQTIRRTDSFKVVAKSIHYLRVRFIFETGEWRGLIPTAQFRLYDGETYEQILDQDMTCEVPHEVLDCEGGVMYVSVFAGDRITVNEAKVQVYKSGYADDAGSSTDPTPSVYTQIMERMADVETTVVESAEAAEDAANRAEQAAVNAGYMDINIDENGHLIYQRTDQVTVDFYLDTDGHLVMEGM